jgi:hypothetical protein
VADLGQRDLDAPPCLRQRDRLKALKETVADFEELQQPGHVLGQAHRDDRECARPEAWFQPQ